MAKIVTVVLKRDGSLHVASDKITPADARRWADEGHSVFLIATAPGRWAVNQLPSGKVFTDVDHIMEYDGRMQDFLQLTFTGEKK